MKFDTSKFSPLAIGVATCVLTGSVGAVAIGPQYGFGPAEGWTIEEITAMTTTVSTNIAAFGSTFGLNMATKFETVIAAVLTATREEALSGNIVSDGTRDSATQLVNAVRGQEQSDQVAKAYLDFNPATGQGYQPCIVASTNRLMDNGFNNVPKYAQARVATLDVAPGRMVDSPGMALSKRLAEHRSKFCSQAEADAGLCSVSDLPGGDTNASLLFEPTDSGSLKQSAQTAYIQHVLGAPDAMIPKTAGPTPQGQAYMLAKNSKDALLSIPAYSLSMIQASNTRLPELDGKSPNEILEQRVNAHFGGADAQKWSNTLAAQSERGLMTEAVKMGGLEVWLHHKQYQQNQRLEMNLAALALASAQDAKAAVDAKYQKIVRDNAAASIK